MADDDDDLTPDLTPTQAALLRGCIETPDDPRSALRTDDNAGALAQAESALRRKGLMTKTGRISAKGRTAYAEWRESGRV